MQPGLMYLENWGLAVLPCSGVADISTSLPRFLCYYVDFLGSTSAKIICWLIQVLKKSIKHEKGRKSFHKSCQLSAVLVVSSHSCRQSQCLLFWKVKLVWSVTLSELKSSRRLISKNAKIANFFLCKCSKNSLKREVYSYLGKISYSLKLKT